MNVEFFVKQIAMNKDKDAYLAQRLVKKYVSYEEKIGLCESIIKSTSIIKDEQTGIEFYKRNTPACNLMFNLRLINLYYDIEINFEHALKDYNALEELGYVDLLLQHIPTEEYLRWQHIMSMTAEDYMENNRSLVAFLSDKMTSMEKTLESVSEVITKVVEQNKE